MIKISTEQAEGILKLYLKKHLVKSYDYLQIQISVARYLNQEYIILPDDVVETLGKVIK